MFIHFRFYSEIGENMVEIEKDKGTFDLYDRSKIYVPKYHLYRLFISIIPNK